MVALVSCGKCSGFWLSCFDYLCLTGAEPVFGLCFYLGRRVCAFAVGLLVDLSGADHGYAGGRAHRDRSRSDFIADGPGLKRTHGKGDGEEKKKGTAKAEEEGRPIERGGASAGNSFDEHRPKSAGGVNNIGGGGMAVGADDENDKRGLKADDARARENGGSRGGGQRKAGERLARGGAGEEEERGKKGEGEEHEGLKPADAEEAGKFLHSDIGEGEEQGGEEGPTEGEEFFFSGPPVFS